MFTKLPPHVDPHIGCMNCGGGEMMLASADPKVIKASMHTRIYNGFGGWRISKDDKTVFMGDPQGEWEDFPTLMKFENMARKEPDSDWRAGCHLPLRSAEYQRQGHNLWVLVESGMGFA
ncbi:MAG: hypothetical protein ABIH03_06160 [Pseudomonadota bacterium]